MGRCKIIGMPFLYFLIISLLFISCQKDDMTITDIILTEESMIINIKVIGWEKPGFYKVGPLFEYINIPPIMTFETEIKKEWQSKYKSTMQIVVNLKGVPRVVFNEEDELFDEDGYYKRILYLFEEIEITINFIRSHLVANIFVEEDKVRIISQKFINRNLF